MKVYVLAIEDASHLGGLMGTEYTTTVLTKTFSTLEKAQKWGMKNYGHGDNEKWEKDYRRRRWSVDRLSYILTVTEQEVA